MLIQGTHIPIRLHLTIPIRLPLPIQPQPSQPIHSHNTAQLIRANGELGIRKLIVGICKFSTGIGIGKPGMCRSLHEYVSM